MKSALFEFHEHVERTQKHRYTYLHVNCMPIRSDFIGKKISTPSVIHVSEVLFVKFHDLWSTIYRWFLQNHTTQWILKHHPKKTKTQLNIWIGQIFRMVVFNGGKGAKNRPWLLTMMMTMVAKLGIVRKWAPMIIQLLLWLLTIIMKIVAKLVTNRKWSPVVLQLLQHQILQNHIQMKVAFQA